MAGMIHTGITDGTLGTTDGILGGTLVGTLDGIHGTVGV